MNALHHAGIDSAAKQAEHSSMNTASDKEYIDARFETVNAGLDGKLNTFEARVDVKFAEVHQVLAEVRTEMQRGFADMTRWIVGAIIGVAIASVTIMTFVLNNATPKVHGPAQAATAPIDIYLQPPGAPQSGAFK